MYYLIPAALECYLRGKEENKSENITLDFKDIWKALSVLLCLSQQVTKAASSVMLMKRQVLASVSANLKVSHIPFPEGIFPPG